MLEDLLLLLDGQHAQHLGNTLETTLLVGAQHGGDVVGDRVLLETLDLGVDVLAVLLVPLSDLLVLGGELRNT